MKQIIILMSTLAFTACTVIRPPIVMGMTHERKKVSAEFDERIKKKYPIGTPEAKVIGSLKRQIFKVEKKENGGKARFDVIQIICKIGYYVHWETDDDQNIKEIKGVVGSACP